MKKCTVCGKQIDRLDYGELKAKTVTKLEVLGEFVKNKQTTLSLILCKKCRTEITSDLVDRILHCKDEVGCSHDCANCDGARI